jgi:hypothetical protein
MTTPPDQATLDQRKIAEMIGKVVLAGISRCNGAGEIISHEQHFGTVFRIDAEGLVLQSGIDGQEVTLPPVLDQYTPAELGNYLLRASGQAVQDPDYVATWQFYPRSRG